MTFLWRYCLDSKMTQKYYRFRKKIMYAARFHFQIMTHLRQFLGHKKIKYLDIAVCSKIIQMHPFIYEFFVIFQIMTHLRPFLDRKNIKWILQSAQK